MTAKEQRKAAEVFAAKWLGRGYEKGECQKFWRGLLHDVFGVADPDDWVQYEVPVATGFVDAYIPRTKVLVEQKGFGHGLADKAAMKQAMMYAGAMPDTMPVRYIVLSNFREFWIYDKHAPEMKPVKVALEDLPKRLSQLSFLAELQRPATAVRDVAAVDKRAGELVGHLYSALLDSYVGEVDDRTLESLNMLCVRLVFCAYAEDAGVFPKRDQFFGIEIDGFAVSVAQTALWIAESQMMAETEEILHRRIDFLPLRRYAHIVRANALRMDWNSLLKEGERFDYILGNPPFVGHQHRTKEQMSDMDEVYAEWKDTSYGKLDYVCAWYRKAVETIRGTSARAAFVSTNSICQGESVAAMWKPLFERGGLTIDFAWRTFV